MLQHIMYMIEVKHRSSPFSSGPVHFMHGSAIRVKGALLRIVLLCLSLAELELRFEDFAELFLILDAFKIGFGRTADRIGKSRRDRRIDRHRAPIANASAGEKHRDDFASYRHRDEPKAGRGYELA